MAQRTTETIEMMDVRDGAGARTRSGPRPLVHAYGWYSSAVSTAKREADRDSAPRCDNEARSPRARRQLGGADA
jgi:hypothetical protein